MRGRATRKRRAKAMESFVLGLSRLQESVVLVLDWFVSILFGSI